LGLGAFAAKLYDCVRSTAKMGFVSPTDLQINSFGARPGPIMKYIEPLMLWFAANQLNDETFNATLH
jgi:hypothetical protein